MSVGTAGSSGAGGQASTGNGGTAPGGGAGASGSGGATATGGAGGDASSSSGGSSGSGGAGGAPSCPTWTYLFSCDIVLPADLGHICVDNFAYSTTAVSRDAAERADCADSGGDVVTSPCPGASTYGSCFSHSAEPEEQDEYVRQYFYIGSTGLDATSDHDACVEGGDVYVANGSDPAASVPAIACP